MITFHDGAAQVRHLSITTLEIIVQNLYRLSHRPVDRPLLILWYYHGTYMLCFVRSLKFSSLSAFHAGSGVHVWEALRNFPLLRFVQYIWSFVSALRLLLIAMWKWLCLLCYRFAPTQINPSDLCLSSCQTRSTTAKQSGCSRTQIEAM